MMILSMRNIVRFLGQQCKINTLFPTALSIGTEKQIIHNPVITNMKRNQYGELTLKA
jgi:hypothetical protein